MRAVNFFWFSTSSAKPETNRYLLDVQRECNCNSKHTHELKTVDEKENVLGVES